MVRRRLSRWVLFAALSMASHLSAGVAWVLAQPSDAYLPRVFLYEVVGVEVAGAPPGVEREAADGPPPAAKVAAAPAPAKGVEPVERPLRRPDRPRQSVEAVAVPDPGAQPVEPEPAAPPAEALATEPLPAGEPATEPLPAGEPATEPGEVEPATEAPGAPETDPAEPQLTPDDLLTLPEAIASTEPGAEAAPLSRVLVDRARVVVFVRTQRLAQSANALALRRAMRAVPGYELYLGQSAFDPLSDFEWMMARNPNLSSTTTTVLMARLAVDGDRARAAVERIPQHGSTVSWRERGGALVGVHGGEPPSREWGRVGWALSGEPRSIYTAGPKRWVERTAPTAAKLASESPIAELLEVQVRGEPADLSIATGRLGPLFGTAEQPGPSVEGVLLAMRFGEGDEESLAAARLWFKTDLEARRFALEARQELALVGAHPLARLLDMSAMAGRLELHQEGTEVTAWLPLESAQASRLLNLVTVLLNRGNAAGAARPAPPRAPPSLQSN